LETTGGLDDVGAGIQRSVTKLVTHPYDSARDFVRAGDAKNRDPLVHALATPIDAIADTFEQGTAAASRHDIRGMVRSAVGGAIVIYGAGKGLAGLGEAAGHGVGVEEGVAAHTGAAGRWWNKGPGVKSVVLGTVPEQSTSGSCMSAVGSLLSGGRFSESQILALLGDSDVEPRHLVAALNKLEGAEVWQNSFLSEDEALSTVSKGPCGARLQVPGELAHGVMIEPLEGGEFLVQDPGIGGTMVVDRGWIRKYVSAAVTRR
jgi:hypothetical protein